MALSILARDPSQPDADALRSEMTGDRLTVGRGPENDLVLPDPDRHLSKRHCVLERHGQDHVLLDVSTNGTFLNYQPDRLDPAPVPLSQGDVILVGRFELVVEITQSDSDAPAGDLPPLGETRGPATANRPFDVDPLGPAAEDDDAGAFLGDLLGGPDYEDPVTPAYRPGASAPDHAPAASAHFSPPRAGGMMIPDDWEDSLISGPAQAQPAPEIPAAPPSPARSVPPPPRAEPTAPPVADDSPFAAPPAATPEPAPAPRPAPAQPAPAQPVPVQTAPVQTAPAPASAQDAAILKAFLDGAGAAHLDLPPEQAKEIMHRTGRVMAAMIAGLREILMTRAALKSEIRVARTMIRPEGNNPLKFSISAEQAVEAMLKPTSPGYQTPEAAVTEVMRDIKAHEVATMTGMEAALKDLLAQFAPDQLSDRIAQQGGFASFLGSRKARAWEAYEKHYADIASATENDFQSTFGKEFARAYEDQIRKL